MLFRSAHKLEGTLIRIKFAGWRRFSKKLFMDQNLLVCSVGFKLISVSIARLRCNRYDIKLTRSQVISHDFTLHG